MRRIIALIIIILSPFISFSQDLSGLWAGTLVNDSTHEVLKYEVFIKKDGKDFVAFSQTWFIIGTETYYGIKRMKARIAKDKKLILVDDVLLSYNYPLETKKNLKQINVLDFIVTNGESFLNGGFETNATKTFSPLTGDISLKKQALPYNSSLISFLQKQSGNNTVVAAK